MLLLILRVCMAEGLKVDKNYHYLFCVNFKHEEYQFLYCFTFDYFLYKNGLTAVEGNPKATFSLAITTRYKRDCKFFHGLLCLPLIVTL